MRGLVPLPRGDRVRERELERLDADRGAEHAVELGAQRGSVDQCGGVRFVRVHRLALDELALDGKQRRQRVVARLEGTHFGLDAEQLRDEVLDVRGDVDQQRGLVLARKRVRRRARGEQAIRQSLVSLAQLRDEPRVEACRPLRRIEVGKFEREGRIQHERTVDGARRKTVEFTAPGKCGDSGARA